MSSAGARGRLAQRGERRRAMWCTRQGCVWRVSFRRSSGPSQLVEETDQSERRIRLVEAGTGSRRPIGKVTSHADPLRALR